MWTTLKNVELLWAFAIICIGISQALMGCLIVWQKVQLSQMKGAVMGLVDDLNAIKEQLGKAKDEIVGKISDLESALAASGTPDPAVSAAVDSLKEAAQALDDVVPDVVAPVEPVPVEPTDSE